MLASDYSITMLVYAPNLEFMYFIFLLGESYRQRSLAGYSVLIARVRHDLVTKPPPPFVCPLAWNALPTDIPTISSLGSLRSLLKHLLSEVLPNYHI